MDPNETLHSIERLLHYNARPTWLAYELEELCIELHCWLVNGGFPPDWEKAEPETADFFIDWRNQYAR